MQRTRTALAAMLDFRESSTAAAVTDRRGPLTADASARFATSTALTMARPRIRGVARCRKNITSWPTHGAGRAHPYSRPPDARASLAAC